MLSLLGVDQEVTELTPAEAEFVNGLASTILLQAVDLLDAPNRSAGWSHADPRILHGQGAASATLVPVLCDVILPDLDGLADRLDRPGAAFLDVGVGVAALSIAMCRTWPRLHVVGVDPFDAALELARCNVNDAGLGGRIELRAMGAENLHDVDAFDLVWFSLPFVPDLVLDAALAVACRSLRPGGWLLTGTSAARVSVGWRSPAFAPRAQAGGSWIPPPSRRCWLPTGL